MMFGLPILGWIGIAGLITILGLGVGLKVEASRLATSKAETVAVQEKFDAFVSEAKALGDAQNAKTKAADAASKLNKEKADAQNITASNALATLYAKYTGLRNSRAGANNSQLPSAPTVTSSTARTCF